MKMLLKIAVLSTCLSAGPGDREALAAAGSELPPSENACALCHGTADLWEADTLRLFISEQDLAEDTHFIAGVNCHDCHGGDPAVFDAGLLHAREDGFRLPLDDVWKACPKCHQEEETELRTGMHGDAAQKGEASRGAALDCRTCHGPKAHGMLSARHRRSPVFLDSQVRLCGDCHEAQRDTYLENLHGQALERFGLAVTALCADCHGAHGVYPASDGRSTLCAANVAATCGKCHVFIEERLQASVHFRETGPAEEAEHAAPGAEPKRKPGCTDCHQGHEAERPDSTGFRLGVSRRCGGCHENLSGSYAISMHGALTELGHGPAATCSDCHGAHDILPISDPASRLSDGNRLQTCRRCHPQAVRSFADFDPHADHRNSDRDPLLYWVYVVLMTLLLGTFGFFGLHSVLWFVRSLIHVVKNGRPRSVKPGETGYLRFKPFHRVAHTVMVMSFLGLALTGLPLKYSQYEWAKMLAMIFGGFESTAVAHRIFGLVNVGCLMVYVARLLRRLVVGVRSGTFRRSVIFGPDSLMPRPRDLKDFFNAIHWFFGLGPKPTFERWTYWEKVDFWGACADIVLIGVTGLILWFPNLFCVLFPGGLLNVAKVIHSTQALLATGFVFAIHFFSTHFRPEKFPMDTSILTGLVSEEELREERPEYFERLRRNGKLDQLRATAPPYDMVLFSTLGGAVALAIGLGLLVGICLGVLGIGIGPV